MTKSSRHDAATTLHRHVARVSKFLHWHTLAIFFRILYNILSAFLQCTQSKEEFKLEDLKKLELSE